MLTGTPISGVTWKSRSSPAPEQLLAGFSTSYTTARMTYLIIDDFHVMNDRGSMKRWVFNQACASAALHLIIGSRFHPNLLSQLQAQDQLVEIHDRDLQFTLEETNTILAARLRYPFSNHHAQRLQSVTEGWIAGM